MVQIYAQEDFKGPDGRMVKKGEVVCQIPKIYGLEKLVQLATLGLIADHEPAAERSNAAPAASSTPEPSKESRAPSAKK